MGSGWELAVEESNAAVKPEFRKGIRASEFGLGVKRIRAWREVERSCCELMGLTAPARPFDCGEYACAQGKA